MREELVRGDPNQGICISLEDIYDNNQTKSLFQWKCSCWSTKDEFLIEWNINVPSDLMEKISQNNSLIVSQISFVKYKDMLYVIIIWSERYLWIYCHDIIGFSNMSAQGVNISIEPKIFDLDLEYTLDSDLENINDLEYKISLPINTGEGEFQFVVSSTILKLHTLKLIVSGDIAQVLSISMSSNWWDIATFNEGLSDEESSNFKRNDENLSEKRSYSHIRSLIDIFSWRNENNNKRNNQELNNNSFKSNTPYNLEYTNTFIKSQISQKRLIIPKYNENILIISFPSIYSKWSISFLCFITTERKLSNNHYVKILILFRHDSFGVLEYCWSLNFDQIDIFKPLNLIAIPYSKNNSSRNIKSISISQIHLSYSPGLSHLFGLFFLYKSNSSIKLLQLSQSSYTTHNTSNEIVHSILNWTIKPIINTNLIYEIIDFNKFNYSDQINKSNNNENLSLNTEFFNIEQNLVLFPNKNSNINSINIIKNLFECIIYNNKQIYILSITNNGQKIVSNNIMDHSNQSNKIYFATYHQNIVYLLVNYQDIPLKIDLNNSNNSLAEYLNLSRNLADYNEINNTNIELNELLLSYREYRNGEKKHKDQDNKNDLFKLNHLLLNNSIQNLDADLVLDSLKKIYEQLSLDAKDKGPIYKNTAKNIKYINILKIIGNKINLLSQESQFYSEILTLWGKCSILLDQDYWKFIKSQGNSIKSFQGSCFDQVTSKYPELRSMLLEMIDINSFI